MTIFQKLRKIPLGLWIFLGALALRFWGLSHGLPDAPNVDENMMVRRALRFGGGDLNPHFFYYPSFSMYLMFFLDGFYYVFGRLFGAFHSANDFAIAFVKDPTVIYLLGRSLIAVADSVTAVLVYQLGSAYFDRRTGIIAGLFWMLFPMAILYAQIAKPDSLMICLMVSSLWILRNSGGAWISFAAGEIIGLAISSKYPAVLLGPSLLLWLWMDKKPKDFVWHASLLGLGTAIGFILGTPYALLDRYTFYHDFVAQSAVMKIGYTGAEGRDYGWLFYLKAFVLPKEYLLITLLALAGIWGWRKKVRPLMVMGLFLAVLYAMLGSRRIFSTHYFLAGFPFIFIIAAAGLSWLGQRFEAKTRSPGLLITALFLVCFSPSLKELAAHVQTVRYPDTRTLARRWIENNIPSGSILLVDASVPQVPMAKSQLEDLYARAVEVGHVKADLFKLQLEADEGKGYFVYLTEQPIMITPKELLEVSRQVQDLVPINEGLPALKKRGIQYCMISEEEWGFLKFEPGKSLYPEHARYYTDLFSKGELLVEFKAGKPNTGPHLWIYRL